MKIEIMPRNTAKCDLRNMSFSWDSNPAAQKLLDVIVYILANEYVRTVKENPTLFSNNGGAK